MVPSSPSRGRIAVIGAGPAGLYCAERLATAGLKVVVFDQMPAPARKFLLAGRGGLNLTNHEPLDAFLDRYTPPGTAVQAWVRQFPPATLRTWADDLGAETFVGSSGRVFPKALKASPLLRAWLARLAGLGVELRLRHRFCGWDGDGALQLATSAGPITENPAATVLALGGGSWPRLGSDGVWTEVLAQAGVGIDPLAPANCGVTIAWSAELAGTAAGHPVKPVAVALGGQRVRGEVVITAAGLEGGPIYALGPGIRAGLASGQSLQLTLDLAPDVPFAQVQARLAGGPGKRSWHRHLARVTGLSPVALRLLREPGPFAADTLAQRIKALPLSVQGLAGMERAISTAGGVRLDAIDGRMMLKAKPGVFVAGEMLAWDAPTGGYLLQGCFASAAAAAEGVRSYLEG